MKRHPELIGLSQEHHHALALCVRILRNPELNHAQDIEQHKTGLLEHFTQEEAWFAAYWQRLPDAGLKERFEQDHAVLREMLNNPRFDDPQWNLQFAQTLRDHARFEERVLFGQITEHCLSEP
ncbi:hypothetical protein [Neisseria wadsworthii]|uniref:Hemerythrin domain-containing protein n=1 Tax=Neisseria wadsworthii 9715 TaxID=1030841 RepID=G4CQF5_9NEIS|nr:hypothetical protein [Neisseria wadsworthii]EGZ46403.1 hypothetical protein HMPREF9370_1315 [Neisseria wadsworthii 9715]QMT35071.1 hemerythrin domain-containing protein [Neisseria wadsworthii]